MSTFPSDVAEEILSRLPVHCVLRCRCVSKTWLTLIDSYEFAKLHSNNCAKTNSNNLCLILRKFDYYGYGKRCFYSVPFDSLNSRVVTPKELTNPLMSCQFNTNILGSCNRLLLISNTVDEIALWNPSTGKHKKLPVLVIAKNDVRVNFGFDYNVINDDYKVVRVVQYDEKCSFHSHVTRVKIPIDTFESLIVAFDLATEKWSLVPRPPYTCCILNLVILGGSLCAYKTYFVDSYGDWGNVDLVLDHVDIWVMKEYGVKDSWTMVSSLEEPDKQLGHTVVPLAFSKNGKEILVEKDNRRFCWTSIDEDSIKIVDTEIGALRGFLHFNSYVYMRSLVQLGSNDEKSDLNKQYNQDKGGNKKALKKRGDDFLSKGFKLKL